MKAVINAKIITPNAIIENHALVFSETIAQIVPHKALSTYKNLEVLNAQGNFLSPGFIDIHTHGCGGVDTMDTAGGNIDKIGQHLLQTGVTSFLPTTMTMPFARIQETLINIRSAMENPSQTGANVLGCHLEGPFISSLYKGAQAERYILEADYDLIASFGELIKIITIAPEELKTLSFIKECRQNKIIVALGHSNATYETAVDAILAGASHLTHTFNAMVPLHHRFPGLIAAAFEADEVTCELIADNFHVHPAMQRMLLANKGKEKIILVTDSMRAALLGDGQYELGGQEVFVKDGKAELANGTLAGSVLTMNKAVYNFMISTKISLPDAVNLAALNPARRIGQEQTKGSITIGKDADLIIFDKELNIFAALIQGNLVYDQLP
jgi:N-acetylglucosamine-6-phosphate deacetylase